jgi:hypothetical protein
MKMKRLPSGCTLYWKTDPSVKSRIYYSDENGLMVEIWNTILVCPSTLLAALCNETALNFREAHKKRKGELNVQK